MKILCNGAIQLHDDYTNYEDINYSFFWEGIIFIKGIPSGIESIKKLSNVLHENGIEKACSYLSGDFFLVMYDKNKEKYYAFVDNSGLFQSFYSANRISTSFLQLIKLENLKTSDLSKRSIVEFINLGNIYFNRTFFDSIKKIEGSQILCITPKDGLNIIEKDIPDLFSKVDINSFLPTFEKIAISLKNHNNISIDLTSGIDSRLCAVIFDHFGMKFETAVSGIKGHRDVELSYDVAKVLGKEHHVTTPSLENISEKMEEAFEICDGLVPISAYIRLLQFQKERSKRNIDLMITATGGEILRDYIWVQDYPSYDKKRSNLKRLFDLRFRPSEVDHGYFSDEYIQRSKNLRDDFVNDLAKFVKDTNTETYDNIYIRNKEKEFAGRMVTNNNRLVKCYAPLLDYDIARIAVNLSKDQRSYGNFEHGIIKQLNPEAAKVKLPKKLYLGVLRYSFFLRDLIKNFTSLKRHLVSFISLPSANDPNQSSALKNSEISQKYIDILYDNGILNRNVAKADIDDEFFGRFLTIGMLIQRMKK